ncbi:MAG: hypothetical protein ACLU4N_07975 [Butyricimonas faecihominis]
MKPLDFIEVVENEMDLENEMDVVDDNENTKGSLTGKATDWQSEYDDEGDDPGREIFRLLQLKKCLVLTET